MAKNLILAKAQNAVMAHDWVTAARLYKELLRGNESNVDYLKELGSIYVKAGEDEKAIPYYEQIITFYPHYIDAMNSLGAIYRRLKRYEESIAILQRALEEGRDASAVYYNLGFTYKEMGNYIDAIDSFETVITENPDDVLAYNHLGSIYFAEKNFEKSIASFKRGLQVDPNHPILNYNLARCYEADKNYTEAIRCYEATLKTRPGWTDAIRDFSGVLIKCQNNKKAQDLVEKSIKLHPRDVDLLCILGRIFLNQFDYDNATKTYKKANSLDSNNIKVLIGFSEALEKGEKTAEALDMALEALEIDPYNKDVRKQYAHTLLSNQRYEQAYENIMALNEETGEKDPQVLDLCAQYYICRGDENSAKNFHEKIQKVNHHYKDYMLSASDRYMQIGNVDKAEECAKEFVERRSSLPDGYNRLGAIYQAKGDMKNAKINYEKGKKYCEPNIIADKGLKSVNDELSANPEKYEYETPEIQIDAEKIENEEEYIPSSFIGEVVGAEEETQQEAENTDENFDYNQLGENVPMGEALLEKDDDFWGDFDDDPNAEPKSLADEESIEAENDTEDDFDSDIFSTLGGSDPGANDDMVDDEEFDFGALDGDKNSSAEDSEEEEVVESEPEVEPESEITTPVSHPAEAPAIYGNQPAIPKQSEAIPSDISGYGAPSPYQHMQNAAFDSADRAMDMAVMTQKMVQKLTDQQRDFEENLALKNEKMIHEEVEKAVEEKIQASMDTQMERIMEAENNGTKDTTDTMDDFLTTDDFVKEEVVAEDQNEDCFDDGGFGTVEEFLHENDVAEEADTSAEDSDDFGSVEEFATDEGVIVESDEFGSVEEFASENESMVEEDCFITVDELAGEEAVPVENPFAEAEELFGEVEDFIGEEAEPFEPEEKVIEESAAEQIECEPEDDFDAVEDFAGVEEFAAENESETEAAEDFAVVEDFAEDENFADVEDFDAGDEFADVEDFTAEAESETETVEEQIEESEAIDSPIVESEDEFDSVDAFVEDEPVTEEAVADEPVINEVVTEETSAAEAVTEGSEIPVPSEYADQLELFKTLRVLSSYLPASEKDSYVSCRIRMMIEYIIAKMSGKPGLLITAKALLESGALGEEYDSQLTAEAEDDLSNAMITHVLKYMKKLAASLNDEKLSKALCLSADNILERIELEDQKSQIF